MTVLHISGARSWGGNEQQLMYLMDELPKYNVTQKLFCFEDTPIAKEASLRPVELLSFPYCKPFSKNYRSYLKDIIKSHQIDIIHLHTSDSVTGYVVSDLFYKLKTRTLFARKGIRRKTSLLSKYKYNYRNIDTILCISQYVKQHFKKILTEKNQEKLVVVYNGVKVLDKKPKADFQMRNKFNIPEDHFLIGNIANHTKAKDLLVLVKTLDEIVNKQGIKNVFLIQIGEYSKLTPEIKNLISEKNLQDYVVLTGFLKKASTFLPQFDVFLITSDREGGPSSLVEALYYKTPVVSTQVGVVEEIIENGINGYSTPIKQPKMLAEKIIPLMNKPQLLEDFAERSYNIFMEKFTAERLGETTFKVYKEMMQKKLNR
ncbi:glycosyltransferase family 4 protein [Christiangramia sediminis]|uniref:Glycosyltransferase family 4 protein n=1 Tax=Christiangramia sediminis TaxID=2881336 RepID=A0A9X1LIA5_9FLAO|nr:glycosyltransferase family 4 protein [Christiangramia sediminis]MCB7480849.1 glycosyltransferase family 4 protein [Christiangramia sediminis]